MTDANAPYVLLELRSWCSTRPVPTVVNKVKPTPATIPRGVQVAPDDRELVERVHDVVPEGADADVPEDADGEEKEWIDRREPVPGERDDEEPRIVVPELPHDGISHAGHRRPPLPLVE